MNQQQVEQWIAANGGPGAVQYTSGKKRLPNPAYGRTLPDGSDNPNWEPGAPQFIESDEEQWVNSRTGATLRVSRKADGSFDVLENRGADPNKPAGPESQPPKEEPNPADPTRMRRWNPTARQWEDAGPNQAEIERRQKAEAERNKPQTVATNTSEPYIVTRQPDGTLKSEPNPNYKGPEPKPGTILTIKGQGGKTYLVPVDAQGNPGPARDSGVPGEKPIPGDAPVFTPDQNEADLGLTAYARAVRQRTDLSKEQQDQLIREAHGTAQTVISRQTSTINTQEGTRSAEITQRGQDAQLAANRLSTASSVYSNALQQAGADTKYSMGADAMAVAPYYMMLGQAASRMFGPTETPARVQNGPAIQQVQQQGLPTVSQVLATAPGNPVAPAVDPAAAAAAEAARQQQIRANPVFRPTPPVAGAAPSPAPPVPPAQQQAAAPQPLSPGQSGMMSPVPDAENPPVLQSPGMPGMMSPVLAAENPPVLGAAPAPAPAEAPPPAPPAAPPLTESGQRVAEQGTVILRHRVTGETRILTRHQWQQEQANAGILGRAANMLWEEVGGAAPDPSIPPIQGPLVEEQAPAPAPAPSGGAFPPLPVVPRAGSEAGGNVQMAPVPQNPVAMALGAGPWQQQPQMQRTGAVGTQLMAADGAYDPASVNDEWLAAGADPAIVAMFGGGRRAVA